MGDLMEALKASIEATKTQRTGRKRVAKEPVEKQEPAAKKATTTRKSRSKVAT